MVGWKNEHLAGKKNPIPLILRSSAGLTELKLNVSLHTKWVIFAMVFPTNLLATTEKFLPWNIRGAEPKGRLAKPDAERKLANKWNKKHLENVGPTCYCKPFYIAIHQVSLMLPLSHADCASMSTMTTTTKTTTRDRGDHYGPMEWAQISALVVDRVVDWPQTRLRRRRVCHSATFVCSI